MRTSRTALCLALAGCGAADDAMMPGVQKIDCVIAGATAFAKTCTVERARFPGATELTVRHADGGFRRFWVTEKGIEAADGAVRAVSTPLGATVEVALGGDRYRLPAELTRLP